MAKWINLCGKKFGELTVTEYLGNSEWKCSCSCGRTVITTTGHLRTGHTKSCGHIRPPRLDLIGKKFGHLTVISWVGNSKWHCKCDCGTEVNVQTSNLRNGPTKSCGCYQRKRASEARLVPMIGKRFGKLTVLERVPNNRYGHVQYKCSCDCGGFVITEAERLRQGRVQSCGCIKSAGEMKIANWLTEHRVRYRPQYSHDKIFLSSGRRPFFDFAVFSSDQRLLFLIEYQGKQHYEYSGNGWDNEENHRATVRRDVERRTACASMGIPLYEIDKKDLSFLDVIMESILAQFPDAYEETSDG